MHSTTRQHNELPKVRKLKGLTNLLVYLLVFGSPNKNSSKGRDSVQLLNIEGRRHNPAKLLTIKHLIYHGSHIV